MSDFSELEAALGQRRADKLYRQRLTLESPQGAQVVIDGKPYLNFCSNDYLGLANHPEVIAAFQQAANDFGVGSGASHLVCGHGRLHQALEEALAEFTGRQRALLFSTGYMANLGIVTALVGKGDAIFEDRLNHASLIDAGLLSGARFQRYWHNDIDSLCNRLARAGDGRRLIAVDGVFSMDGDLAPLPALAQVAAQHRGWLLVDDAHGLGVLGATGAGSCEHFGLSAAEVPILMGTLGKSFGGFGAFVAGSDTLIETLIQFARSYIYTTALPPAVAAAALASLGIVQREPERRAHLTRLIEQFRSGARARGLPMMDSVTAVQPLLVGDNAQALAISDALRARGFLVGAIRPPTVPAGTARLRITLSAAHSSVHLEQLLDALREAWLSVPGVERT